MKILHTVEFYEPSKGGSEEVVRQISERLAKLGHEVTVATSYHANRDWSYLNGVKVKQFKIKGNQVKGITGEIESYLNFVTDDKFDILLNYNVQVWPTDLVFLILDKIKAKKFLCPVGFSKLKNKKYSDYYNQMPSHLAKYDKLFYTSPNYQDKNYGDELGLMEKAIIIPNGSDREEFLNPQPGFREKFNINTKYMFLSVSNHYLAKGHSFVIEAFKKLNNEDATLVIIGEKPQLHSWYSCYPYCKFNSILNKRIKILNDVPREWVVSAFLEADLFLFGSKVECAPLVMYECFASKIPFITKPAGNVLDHEEMLWVVNNPDEMFKQINNFLKNPTLYHHKSQKAFEEFEIYYDWEKITDIYENTYLSILKM